MRKLSMSNFGTISKINCYMIKAKCKIVFMVYKDLYQNSKKKKMSMLKLFLKGQRLNSGYWSPPGMETGWARTEGERGALYCVPFCIFLVTSTILFIQKK